MTENEVNPSINNDPMEKRNEFIDHPSYIQAICIVFLKSAALLILPKLFGTDYVKWYHCECFLFRHYTDLIMWSRMYHFWRINTYLHNYTYGKRKRNTHFHFVVSKQINIKKD